MRFYGTTERTEDNEQTPLSAQKNAIYSSQRLFWISKKIKRRNTIVRAQKTTMFFITALLWTNNKG